jgi:hypothetical protein
MSQPKWIYHTLHLQMSNATYLTMSKIRLLLWKCLDCYFLGWNLDPEQPQSILWRNHHFKELCLDCSSLYNPFYSRRSKSCCQWCKVQCKFLMIQLFYTHLVSRKRVCSPIKVILDIGIFNKILTTHS